MKAVHTQLIYESPVIMENDYYHKSSQLDTILCHYSPFYIS